MITKKDQLFGSKIRNKLLAKLILNKHRSFYIRELEKNTGLNYSSIHKELVSLKRMGIVTDEIKGKIRLFRINKSSPIYQEISSIVLKTVGIGDVIRDALKDVGNIKCALIFGSFARGEEKDASDIDLLIIGEIDEEKLIAKIKSAEDRTGREINYVIWSEKELNKRAKEKMGLLVEIEKNPMIMIIGDKNEFRKAVKRKHNSKSNAG